ncbi:VOC family protein [Inquilinus limosus]|uniref:VOC family protein n=1 Tax=Inquilinus limosus TaxID=171674 RepID=UPI003F155EC8
MIRARRLLAAVIVAGFLAVGPVARAQLVTAVDAVGITVGDMDRALAFYTGVLSFSVVSDREVTGPEWERLTGVFGARLRIARLELGDEAVELIQYLTPAGRPIPADSRSNDRWFQHIAIIVSDMDRAYALLRQNKVRYASTEPQTLPSWNPKAAGIRAFYFKDPDGNPLEILQFPPGKGQPWWQAKDRLFLGIDHTAIVVTDTAASLALYRDRLGLEVVGESENYGPEQEHLNNVFGARLRITTLRAASGPGIEFLEYLTPTDGRPAPADTRANDLWHEQVELVTADVAAAADTLREARSPFVSSGIATVADEAADERREFMIRDPDGHALLLTGQGGLP